RGASCSHRTRLVPEPLSRDYGLWYEDGTIILIARNVEFRVYRGPLAKHSPLFRDMLSNPQPIEPHLLYQEQEQSPECPLIHLSDSPEDLRHVLRVFTIGRSFEHLHFHAISAWIRLGHKYRIDKLVDEGLYHLRRAYPTALPCAIAVVNLARLTESHDLLPFALLECCDLEKKITQGFTREDGSREFLSPEDLEGCFAAKETLVLWNVRAAIGVSESVSVDYECHFEDETCHHMDVCKEWIQRWRRKFKRGGLSTVTVDDLMAEGKVEAYRSPNLCPNCLYHAGERIYKERQKFWNALPAYLTSLCQTDGRLRLWRVIRHPETRRSEDACIFLHMIDIASAVA
ncbi:hypothetical protein DICSQDRAFT_63341, partial [Dichomitus squalens LYAD-421 SS1]